MVSSKCALCDVKITEENDTKEHLIPNSIGGRKKITGFICNKCNNNSGDKWECELAKQLNPLSLFFCINRERGDSPSQLFETTGGDIYKLNADGSMNPAKPIYKEEKVESGERVNIHICARSVSEAKQMLQGVKRKYPQIELDEIFSNVKTESSYCPDMLKFNLSFGGPDAGRSIVKSALALAVKSGISLESCIEAINYLRNEDAEACFGYYYSSDLIKNRPVGIPLHCISIKGCTETKQVIGYVEYFGVQRMILCLGREYNGKEITGTYSINPITGEELDLFVDLSLSNDEIRGAYDYTKTPNGAIEAAFESVLTPAMRASYEKEMDRVLNEAVKVAFENCGAKEGDVLNEEHANKIASIMVENMMPFMINEYFQRHRK